MALEVVGGAVLGAVIGELLKAVIDAKQKASSFQPSLTRLESTLKNIRPRLHQISRLNHQLDHPEMDDLEALVKDGKALVLKCSKISTVNIVKKVRYSNKLLELESSLLTHIITVLSLDNITVTMEILVVVKELQSLQMKLVGLYNQSEPAAGTPEIGSNLDNVDQSTQESKILSPSGHHLPRSRDSTGNSTAPSVVEQTQTHCHRCETSILSSDVAHTVSTYHPAHHMENASSSSSSTSRVDDIGSIAHAYQKMCKWIMPARHNPSRARVADIGLIAFTYKELLNATANFSETQLVGVGGFATVYKGFLSSNRKVAVKLLKNENHSHRGEMEFWNEVDILSRCRHINIVSLIGYCITKTKKLLVYEFVEFNSLQYQLRGGNSLQPLDWAIRMKIAQGVAKGLAYLHGDCGPQKIIHRDVKPANILIDSNFVAKVADFGIAKLCLNSELSPNSDDSCCDLTTMRGTIGFLDPHYLQTSKFSFKSDVYSFGVVLLELISGETNYGRVYELMKGIPRALGSRNFVTIADPKLERYNLDEMALMVTCVKACLRKHPKDRPHMIQVSHVLEKIISADKLKNEESYLSDDEFSDSYLPHYTIADTTFVDTFADEFSDSDYDVGR